MIKIKEDDPNWNVPKWIDKKVKCWKCKTKYKLEKGDRVSTGGYYDTRYYWQCLNCVANNSFELW